MALKTKWLFAKNKSMSCTMTAVWRAVVGCKGCAVIFHSPMGCVHVAASMDLGNHYRLSADGEREVEETVPLVSSNLREKDSIFGGIDRLHECIAYAVKTCHPECLVIASSCVAGVIGDDVDEEAREAEETYGIPVLSMAFSGFLGGEYSDGYYKTMDAIMHRFFKKQDHKKGKVLLLGDQMGPEGQYAREVKRLLSFFGLTVDFQFPGYVPFSKWSQVTEASLSVLLGTAGQPKGMKERALWLEREFGIPFLGDCYPLGLEGTWSWIRRLADFMKEKEKGEALIREEMERVEKRVSSFLPVTEGKKVFIAIGRGRRWYHPSGTIQSLQKLHMEPAGVMFFSNLTEEDMAADREEISALGDIPVYHEEEGQKSMETADVLLTTNEIYDSSLRQLFIPMVPLAGTEGELAFLTSLYRLLCRHGRKGGMTYVKM
ncbi:nitrogenase component 1 [Dialister succinatiphilus]|uniref:nitrogenase component 1 n=1 Tax=Dialister succinatiphilus TaxID=487173 RepID=UPI00235522DA|nr:nitrogenase component 1 [Dialister succinatiphilus]